MKRFEYMGVKVEGLIGSNVEKQMNGYGKDGWDNYSLIYDQQCQDALSAAPRRR